MCVISVLKTQRSCCIARLPKMHRCGHKNTGSAKKLTLQRTPHFHTSASRQSFQQPDFIYLRAQRKVSLKAVYTRRTSHQTVTLFQPHSNTPRHTPGHTRTHTGSLVSADRIGCGLDHPGCNPKPPLTCETHQPNLLFKLQNHIGLKVSEPWRKSPTHTED